MSRLAVCLLLLLVATALVPVAAASHTMGHRYLVFGRVIGADGMPVQNMAIQMQIVRDGNPVAAIVSNTNCLGDFQNWDGQPGSDPPGGGQIEQQSQHDPPYIAFHFHDSDLSDRFKVQLSVAGETWQESFHSATRQTSVRHQLTTSPVPGAACGGYQEFNTTFSLRISALSKLEMKTGDVVPATRTAEVFFNDQPAVNGTTDYNGAFLGNVRNTTATAAVGTNVRIVTQDVGTRTYVLSDADVRFHRLDAVYVLPGPPADLTALYWLGGIAAGGGLVFGAFWLFSRAKSSMEEKKLRETTTRRRFRKGGD